jgi:hypothetical protein
MRLALLICLALVGTPFLAGQEQPVKTCQPTSDDLYSIGVVSRAMRLLNGEEGINVFTKAEDIRYIRPLIALGDRVSIAVLKTYSVEEILQVKNADAYLTVVRNAFSSRSHLFSRPGEQSCVVSEVDADPKVTLFVLTYLKYKMVSSPGIEKRIAYLGGCVKDFTCSSQGEYAFFHKP